MADHSECLGLNTPNNTEVDWGDVRWLRMVAPFAREAKFSSAVGGEAAAWIMEDVGDGGGCIDKRTSSNFAKRTS